MREIDSSRKYWFPAKRYGWGWGLPRTWQGWAVLGGYVVFMFVGRLIFQSLENRIGLIVYAVVLSVVLGAICYGKGEPPRWRWGGR